MYNHCANAGCNGCLMAALPTTRMTCCSKPARGSAGRWKKQRRAILNCSLTRLGRQRIAASAQGAGDVCRNCMDVTTCFAVRIVMVGMSSLVVVTNFRGFSPVHTALFKTQGHCQGLMLRRCTCGAPVCDMPFATAPLVARKLSAHDSDASTAQISISVPVVIGTMGL